MAESITKKKKKEKKIHFQKVIQGGEGREKREGKAEIVVEDENLIAQTWFHFNYRVPCIIFKGQEFISRISNVCNLSITVYLSISTHLSI